MKLTLKNFCCWEDKTFDFPDTGNILLSAPSGSGKTSIIRAIMFALFGTGNKIVTHGKKKCSVELVFHDLHILRTKSPCNLTVNYTLENDEAQKFLNLKFANDMFHLDQHTKNTFVLMNPLDKLSYLEDLALHDVEISQIKEKIKKKIKRNEGIVQDCESKLSVYQSLLNELIIPEMPNLTKDEMKLNSQEIEEKIERLKNQSIDLKREKQVAQHVEEVTQQLNQLLSQQDELPTYKDVDLLIKSKEIVLEKIEQCKKYQKYQKYLDEYNNQKNLLDDSIQHKKEKLEIEIQNLKTVDFKFTKLDCETQIDNFKKRKEMVNQLAQLSKDVLDKSENLEQERKELERKIRNLELLIQSYECPSCSTRLRLNGNRLETVEKVIDDQDVSTHLRNSKKQLKEIGKREEQQAQSRYVEKQIEKLEKIIEKIPEIQNIDEIKEIYQSILDNEQQIKHCKKELKTVNSSFETMSNKLDTLEKKCEKWKCEKVNDNLEDLIVQHSDLEREINHAEINNLKIKKIARQIRALETEIESQKIQKTSLEIEQEIYSFQDLIIENNKLLDKLFKFAQYTDCMDKKHSYESTTRELNSKHNSSQNLVKQLQMFQHRILQAEGIAISQLIETINASVQFYLEQFFDDTEPMIVYVTSTKDSKKIKKVQIGLEIHYKNNIVDFQTLSGGERDRVILAFTLAFADINNSPLIILDECTSSLDQETANKVFEFIQQDHDRLYIIVAHQVVTGLFDKVIQI